MFTARNLAASLAFLVSAGSVLAQQAPTAAASAPMSAGMTDKGCTKAGSRHDHGAERNAPSAKTSPCPAAAPASGAKARAKHDHAKFHKNQG
ncbi:MAG: hypothetical protein V4569_00390 [Pseudomonadota bacterium]